jgi:hypothetical protein
MSLSKVYYDPKLAAGLGSVAKLLKASKNKKMDVEEWQNVPSKSIYCNKYKRRVGNGSCGFKSLSRYNDKYKYLSNVIDIFSLCVERTSKGQDWHLDHSGFKIFISK